MVFWKSIARLPLAEVGAMIMGVVISPMIRCFTWCVLWFGLTLLGWANGQQPGMIEWQPEPSPDGILEPWRWTEYDMLQGKTIRCAAEDAEGHLWFANIDALLQYDGWKIHRYPIPDGLLGEDSLGFIRSLLATRDFGMVGAAVTGVFRFHEGQWEQILDHRDRLGASMGNQLVESQDGVVWIGSPLGLHRLGPDGLELILESERGFIDLKLGKDELWMAEVGTGRVVCARLNSGGLEDPMDWTYHAFPSAPNTTSNVCIARDGTVWVAASDRTITVHRLDRGNARWIRLAEDFPITSYDTPEAWMTVTLDGNLLVRKNRVLLLLKVAHVIDAKPEVIPFSRHYSFVTQRNNGNLILGSLRGKVFEIEYRNDQWKTYPGLIFQCETQDGVQWFITRDGGVVSHDPVDGRWWRHTVGLDSVTSLTLSDETTVWAAGSHRDSAAVAVRNAEGLWVTMPHPELGPRICYNSAVSDGKGGMYFGSGIIPVELASGRGGWVYYSKLEDSRTPSLERVEQLPQRTFGMAIGPDEVLWIGGYSIHRFDPKAADAGVQVLERHQDMWIDHLLVDSENRLWIALWGMGVASYSDAKWTSWGSREGLDSLDVSYLIKDVRRTGHLIAATDGGLAFFDGHGWSSQRFPDFLNMRREAGSLKQSRDGALWLNRFNRNWYDRDSRYVEPDASLFSPFHTVRWRSESAPPRVQFDGSLPLETAERNLFLRWMGQDHWNQTATPLLQYSYRLGRGPWSPFSERRDVMLVDLDLGAHQFEVRARDLNGNITVEPAMIEFRILPPLWRQPWFMLFVGFGFTVSAGLILLNIRLRIRHIRELEQAKIDFFTNVTHELRTPLMVISGPLESALKSASDDALRDKLQMALRGAQKTSYLVDQLLDFRKHGSGNWPGHLIRSDIVEFCRELTILHRVNAKTKAIELTFESEPDALVLEFDEEKLSKALDNLIANAIKYTQEGGHVRFAMSWNSKESKMRFRIEDDGPGIPKRQQRRVFDPFYRGGLGSTKGTGLGLPLVRELVRSMKGSVELISPVADGRGASFDICLPFWSVGSLAESVVRGTDPSKSLSVLIVEDDADTREFLARELGESFNIQTACDGQDAWEQISLTLPDLVVTDVRMAPMDGIQLCELIKSDKNTSHIPVIMLSSLGDPSDRIKGLSQRADDYLGKPVKPDLLKLKIANILDSRAKSVERYREQLIEPSSVLSRPGSKSHEDAFLNRLIAVIEQQMHEPSFDVEALSEAMHMSRATLYRKTKSLTGDSPITLIQKLRMRRAAELLLGDTVTISEILERIGLLEHSYFSACFKKHYHCKPSEYRQRHKAAVARDEENTD